MQTLNLMKKDSDFQPTQEELNTIRDKMKDPEFMKLWVEYAKELSDPKHRAEEEEYLRQMEREAKEGGDFSFDFIFPKPIFCVRLLADHREGRTFINICECDKVEPFSEEQKKTESNDANWHIPVVCGKPHSEHYESMECDVYDCVFHPKTVSLANRSDRFMTLIVEIAIENINAGYNKSFGFEFARLSGCSSLGEPKNQTIRRKNPQRTFPSETVPQAQPASRSVNPTPAKAKLDYKIMHRGEIDLSDAWNWKHADRRIGVPRELVVLFKLPTTITSASQLDIEVPGHCITFKCDAMKCDEIIELPFSVDETPQSARFDKAKHELTIVLSVIPPPAPPCAKLPASLADDEQIEAVPQSDKSSALPVKDDDTVHSTVVGEAFEGEPKNLDGPSNNAPGSTEKASSQAADASTALEAVRERVEEARRARIESERFSEESTNKHESNKPSENETAVEQKLPLQQAATSPDADQAHFVPAIEATSSQPEELEVVDLRTAGCSSSPGVVLDDDDDAVIEQRALLQQTQKKIRAEKEAQRAEAELAKKMTEVPLCSRHIFAID